MKVKINKKAVVLLTLFVVLIVLSFFTQVVFALSIKKSKKIPVLVYHDFSSDESINLPYTTPARLFEEEMKYLFEHGYHVITLKKLINYMQTGEPLPEKAVAITIDDGYESNYFITYPILKKYNMPATIFFVVGDVSLHEKGKIPKLSWDEMKEMEDSGLIDIQAHTFSLHQMVYVDKYQSEKMPAVVARAYLPDKDRQETVREYQARVYGDLLESRTVIEKELCNKVDTLSWPYGIYSIESLKLAQKAGFKYFVTCNWGMNETGDSIKFIRRIAPEGNMSMESYVKLIEPDYSFKSQLKHSFHSDLYRLKELFL